MKKIIGYILILLFATVLILPYLKSKFSTYPYYVKFINVRELQNYLSYDPDKKPLIGAHRGGPMRSFPENAIETFENALSYAPCLIECDVRKSKDGVLVMMHDETLARTTSGRGLVSDYTISDLQKFDLINADGKVTDFKIPTLREVLEWSKGKAIIEIDRKNDVSPNEIVSEILASNAISHTVVIAYTLKQLDEYAKLHKDLMISASAHTVEGVQRILDTGIDPKRLLVFVGVTEPDEKVYKLLHKKGIRSILGTMHNIDNSAKKKGARIYKDLLKNGADILATDNVPFVAEAIEEYLKENKEK